MRSHLLRCQRIQERIHEKSSSQILGVDSGGDTGLDVSTDASDDDEESEEENGLEVEKVVAGNAGVAGSMAGSRTATPNGLLEVGLGVIAPEQVEDGIPSLPPLLPSTQQYTEGSNGIPQQQLIFSPEAMYLSQQQRAHQHPVITQQSAAGQPMVVQPMVHRPVRPTQQQPVQPTQQQPIIAPQQPKKKAKRSSESPLSNEKTKNSLSEKRGSIVKSIDKLASSLTTDDANNAAMASASVSSSMMPMMFMMQMQHQQQMQQQQQQQQQQQMQRHSWRCR